MLADSETVSRNEMRYYHGSPRILETGTVVRPRKSSFVRSENFNIPATEAIFEESRLRVAPHAIPRRNSVYMSASPSPIEVRKVGGKMGAIHEVVPKGRVERNHMGWWNMVNAELAELASHQGRPCDGEAFRLWADAYWRGDAATDDHPLFARSQRRDVFVTFTGFEFRARSFEVVGLADSTVRFAGGRVFVNDRTTYFCLDEETDVAICGLTPVRGAKGRTWMTTSDRDGLALVEQIVASMEAEATLAPAP
jgi:hypothetical protein